MKRTLCVIMCCVIVAALSISVFAADLPDNDVIGGITLRSVNLRYYDIYTDDSNSITISLNKYYPFGEVTQIGFQVAGDALDSSYPDRLFIFLNFDIILNDLATIYIPFDSNRNWEDYNFGALSDYRLESQDITVDLVPASNLFGIRLDTSSGESTSVTFEEISQSDEPFIDVTSVDFLCFRDVPKGTYNISIMTPENEDGSIYTNSIFYVAPFVTIPTFYDDVESGYISVKDAIESVLDNVDTVLNSNASNEEKQLAAQVALLDLERIRQISNNIINVGGASLMVEAHDLILHTYASLWTMVNEEALEFLPLVPSMLFTELYPLFTEAMLLASSIEESMFLESIYNTLVLLNDSLYKSTYDKLMDEKYDDPAANEDVNKLLDLEEMYQVEEDLLNQFSIAKFKESIDYTDWLSSLRSDYLEYKSIYNWFFDITKSGSIANFLIMPFFLVITSILLGTAMGVKKS